MQLKATHLSQISDKHPLKLPKRGENVTIGIRVGALIRTRVGALLAATALLTSATVAVTTTPASAASITFSYEPDWGDGQIVAFVDGHRAGVVWWQRDPGDRWPVDTGDTLCAYDETADGWGITGQLYPGPDAGKHDVSTAGHDSPYWDCQSGDLPEDQTYYFYVTMVKGTQSVQSYDYITVTS
ncbi:hypothetical protein [Streptomyces sp. NPDC057375]|uniref:hypothetical protein n=1 Tax=Streptomyces sp. NPDC057375 TaxID=3346109 RepID=UPI00362663B8